MTRAVADGILAHGMARKLRIQYPGAVYHVMNRGDRRESIFHDDADRQRFIETLDEACGKTETGRSSLLKLLRTTARKGSVHTFLTLLTEAVDAAGIYPMSQ